MVVDLFNYTLIFRESFLRRSLIVQRTTLHATGALPIEPFGVGTCTIMLITNIYLSLYQNVVSAPGRCGNRFDVGRTPPRPLVPTEGFC